jgi:hypothetical protein
VSRLGHRVEEAVVAVLVMCPGVEPTSAAPAAARHDLAAQLVNERGAVGDEHRVNVSDVDRRAGGLALVVELREQLEH